MLANLTKRTPTVKYVLLIGAIMIAWYLGIGASGGGCIGTQKPITMTGGSSAGFNLISPTNSTVFTTGLTPRLSWNPYPTDLTSYTVQIALDVSFTAPLVYQNINIRRDAIAFDVPANVLQQNTIYFWRVIAVDSDTGTSVIASNAPFTFMTGVTPSSFSLLSPANNETLYALAPTLIWSQSAQATNYILQINDKATFNEPFILAASLGITTTYSIPLGLLKSGLTYYWRVQTTATGETTTASNAPFSFYVADAPGTFLLLTPPDGATPGNLTPSFTWSGAFLAASYTFDVAISPTFNVADIIYTQASITDTAFTMPAGIISNDIAYYWRVTAINGIGSSLPSNGPFSFRPDIGPKPFSLSTPVSGSVMANLTPTFGWTASSSADQYLLEISTAPNFATVLQYPAIVGTTYTISAGSLIDNQTYWWRVWAINNNVITQTAATNAPFSFTTNIMPGTFTLVSPISGTTATVLTPTFTWTVSSLATEYRLEIAKTSIIPWVSYITFTGITTTSYTVSGGLQHGQTYWWRVVAISSATNRTTLPANAPFRFSVDVAPLSFTLWLPVSGTIIKIVNPTFTWTASAQASSYTIQFSLLPDFSSLVYEGVDITDISYTLPEGILSTGKAYYWRVRALNQYVTFDNATQAQNAPLLFLVNVSPGAFALSLPISGSTLSTLTPTLQWGPSALATTYYLQIASNSAFTPPLVYENTGISTTSFIMPQNALAMGVQYWWRVQAENQFGSLMAGNAPYSFKPTTMPLNFYLVSPNTDSIQNTLTPTFTWTSSVYATTYTLQISNLLSFATLLYENTTIPASATSFQLDPSLGILVTAKTYYWRVIASNNEGQGQTLATNAPFTLTTQVFPTAFALIEPVNGTTIYTLSPLFRWENSSILDNYDLQVALTNTFSSLVYENASIPVSTTLLTIPNSILVANTTYFWRVIAQNASGTTVATNAPFQFIAGAAPDTFELVSPASGTIETVLTPTLTWQLAANAHNYTVEISEYSTFTPTVVYRSPGLAGSISSHDVPLNILASRRIYFWHVIAGNEFGQTTASNEPFEFETFSPNTPPEAFNMISPVDEAVMPTYTPMISWVDTRGEISYRLEVVTNTAYFNDPAFDALGNQNPEYVYVSPLDSPIPRNSTAFTLTIDALPDIGRYYWRVIAVNEWGETIAANAPFAMIVDPTTSPWKPISTNSFKMFEARSGATAIWTGSEAIIWGGKTAAGLATSYLADGIRYNPGLDTWDYINDIGAPSTRSGHTAIWTGTYMIIWGGFNGTSFLNDGAMYNPNTDSWTPLGDTLNAPPARNGHIAVWASSRNEMIVWGGFNSTDGYLGSGARYSLTSNNWSPMANASTNTYYQWGTTGYWWNPVPQQYFFNKTISAPAGRDSHTGVWDDTTSRLFIWGGKNGTGNPLGTGGIYRPSDNSWWELTFPDYYSYSKTPAPRYGHTATWNGNQMIVYGGTTGRAYFPNLTSNDGRYSPAAPPELVVATTDNNTRSIYNDMWTPLPLDNIAASRTGHTAVWTGGQMIVWGGINDGGYLNTGGKYSPFGDFWTSMTLTGQTPSARDGHVAVWTGDEMFVWGGQNDTGYLDSGGRYNPVSDSWIPLEIPVIGPPVSRELQTMLITDYDVNWQDPVLDKNTLSAPSTPKDGDRYLIDGIADSTTVWAGQDFNIATWSQSSSVWLFTTRQTKMAVYVRSDKLTYEFDGTNWNATDLLPKVIIWGGSNGATAFRSGAIYNPIDDNWTSMRQSSAPDGRYGHTAVWTYPITITMTPRMLVFGGFAPPTYRNDGGEYLPGPLGGFWNPLPMAGAPPPRAGHTAIWAYDPNRPNTSNEMITWGGYDGSNYLGDGGRYDVIARAWTPITLTDSPTVRRNHTAIWANTIPATSTMMVDDANHWPHPISPVPAMMIVWGGLSTNNNRLNTGGIYIPVYNMWDSFYDTISATWVSRPMAAVPSDFSRRDGHSAVWTSGSATGQVEWLASTLLSTYDVGRYSSIALDSLRFVHIAFYNFTSGDLQYITNAPSGSWQSTTIDNPGNVGEYCAIAVDHNDKVHISYYDRTNGFLKYATNASGSWTTERVDPSTSNHGLYTAIAIGPTNKVHISYYDWSNSALKYATGNRGAWTISPVDSPGDVGQFTSIAVDVDNKAYISYYDATNAHLKYATVDGGSILYSTVDTTSKDTGMYSSIGVDNAKNVYIAYYNRTDGRLRFISNVTGTFIGAIEEPEAAITADHGMYASLAVNSAVPTTTIYVSYYDKTNGVLKYITKNAYSGTWNPSAVIDRSGDVGQYTCIATDQSKNSYISYYDAGSGDLKYATNAWTWRNKMIVWGGYDGANYLNSGAMYDPVGNSWREISTINAPTPRAYHNAVFAEWKDSTGRNRSELIVWGGWDGTQYLLDGGQYDPALDRWQPINTVGAPAPRSYHSGIWMDFIRPDIGRPTKEMLIWGGAISGGFTYFGSRYKP